MSLLLALLTPPGPLPGPTITFEKPLYGPRGFLGMPVGRRFEPTPIGFVPEALPPPPADTNVITIELTSPPGVRGMLGVPSRRFRERVTIGFVGTQVRISQSQLEAWTQYNPELRVSQSGLEVWNQYNPTLRISQVQLEVWISLGGNNRRLVNVYYL